MSTSPLVNTKSALVFAGITIFGTLMMVGPSENGGVLDRVMDRFGQQSEPAPEPATVTVTQAPPKVVEPLDPAAGWGGTGEPVFGDYASTKVPASEILPEEASPAPGNSTISSYAPAQVRRVSALPQSTGGPVKADSLGELVPRNGSGEAPRGEAVVTSRAIKIEPE